MAETGNDITVAQDGIVLDEDQLVYSLTNRVVKAAEKELTLQSMIAMMTEEYGFAIEDMERDFRVKYEDSGKKKSQLNKMDALNRIWECGSLSCTPIFYNDYTLAWVSLQWIVIAMRNKFR